MTLGFNKLIQLALGTSSYLYLETCGFWGEGNRNVNMQLDHQIALPFACLIFYWHDIAVTMVLDITAAFSDNH